MLASTSHYVESSFKTATQPHTHTPRPLEHYRRLTKWRHTHTHTRQQRATPHTHTQANTHQKDFTAGPKRGVRGIQSVNKMVGTAPSLPEGETELQPCCLHVIKEQACVSERRLQDCWALKENSAVFFLLFNLMNVSDQLQHSDSESTAFRHECRNHANLFGAQGF